MHRCEDCRLILDSDVRFCPQCGKSVEVEQHVPQLPDAQMDMLITSANLHRIRKEWDEAVSDATEALKLDPNRAEVAALLGMIYEERGMLDQALLWQQMAVELNPKNATDKARLERVQSQMPRDLTDSFGRFVKRSKTSAIVMGSAFVLIVLLALLLAFLRHGAEPGASRSSSTSQIPGYATRPRSPGPGNGPREFSKQEGGTSAPPPAAAAPASTRTPGEVFIESELASSQAVGQTSAKVDDVIADPRTNDVWVTFSMPAQGSVSKPAVIKAAVAIARTVFGANNQAKFVTARCELSVGNQAMTQVAFIGDTARSSIESLPAQATDQQLEAAFANVWWNPQIK